MLETEIAAMEASGNYPHDPLSYRLWDMMTEYGVLPYAGGYLQQPAWFDADVRYFGLKQRLYDLQISIEHRSDDLTGDKRHSDDETGLDWEDD
jgi:hypothetical protein